MRKLLNIGCVASGQKSSILNMLKIFLITLSTALTVYLIGEKIRRNPKIDKFLLAIEGRYSRINELLEDSTIKEGLFFLKKMYGWLAIVLFALIWIIQRFFKSHNPDTLSLFFIFSLCFMGWFSIKWIADHKKTVLEMSRTNVMLIFGPLALAAFDVFLHTEFMHALTTPIYQMAAGINIRIPEASNPFVIGGVISAVYLICLSIYYIITWVMVIPMYLFSVAAIFLPIKFSRLLSSIDKENTFFWFAVILWSGSNLWLGFFL